MRSGSVKRQNRTVRCGKIVPNRTEPYRTVKNPGICIDTSNSLAYDMYVFVYLSTTFTAV